MEKGILGTHIVTQIGFVVNDLKQPLRPLQTSSVWKSPSGA